MKVLIIPKLRSANICKYSMPLTVFQKVALLKGGTKYACAEALKHRHRLKLYQVEKISKKNLPYT